MMMLALPDAVRANIREREPLVDTQAWNVYRKAIERLWPNRKHQPS